MKTNVVPCAAIAALICLLSTGCASIVSGRRADVTINSYPSNAHVVVRDDQGKDVASCTTPGTVSLKRNRKWGLPARYTASIESPGYETAEVPIRSTMNPWIFGNVVFGGIPGLLVDNVTGAAWQPKDKNIHRDLLPSAGQDPLVSQASPSINSAPDPMQPAAYVAEQPRSSASRTAMY